MAQNTSKKTPERPKVKIIERHKLLLKQLSENIRNGMTMEQAMVSVGYTPSYAKTSTRLKNSDSWQELIKQNLPDEMLVKVHKQGLNATTKKPHLVDRDDKGRPIYEYKKEEDYSVRHKYLDTAYKLKGSYAPSEVKHSGGLGIFGIIQSLNDADAE